MLHQDTLISALLTFTLALSGCGSADPASPKVAVPQDSQLRAAFVELAEEGGLPGMAYAVVDSEGIVEAEGIGFANIENGTAATPDTLFHVGSTHKALNALLVATLVDDGTVGWDTALADLVRDFDIDPAITVRHLLTMTGGIAADDEDLLPVDVSTQVEVGKTLLLAIEDAELLAAPGAVFEYSNISASAAGYAASLAAYPDEPNLHQSYIELLQARVLGPLGMNDSYLLASDAQASGQLSRSYELDGADPVALATEDVDLDVLAPSGSLKSTANDMALFLQMLLSNGTAIDGTQVVSRESIDTMWTPVREDYAMGWEVSSTDGVSFLSHEGSFDGFLSVIVIIPDEDLALVALTNAEDAAADLIAAAPNLLIHSVAR